MQQPSPARRTSGRRTKPPAKLADEILPAAAAAAAAAASATSTTDAAQTDRLKVMIDGVDDDEEEEVDNDLTEEEVVEMRHVYAKGVIGEADRDQLLVGLVHAVKGWIKRAKTSASEELDYSRVLGLLVPASETEATLDRHAAKKAASTARLKLAGHLASAGSSLVIISSTGCKPVETIHRGMARERPLLRLAGPAALKHFAVSGAGSSKDHYNELLTCPTFIQFLIDLENVWMPVCAHFGIEIGVETADLLDIVAEPTACSKKTEFQFVPEMMKAAEEFWDLQFFLGRPVQIWSKTVGKLVRSLTFFKNMTLEAVRELCIGFLLQACARLPSCYSALHASVWMHTCGLGCGCGCACVCLRVRACACWVCGCGCGA